MGHALRLLPGTGQAIDSLCLKELVVGWLALQKLLNWRIGDGGSEMR